MKRILVIEDDPGIRDTIRIIFERINIAVDEMSRADKVFTREYEIPDLFILDKQLPGIDGLDVLRYLKKQPDTAHLPVVMLSASPHIMALAARLGADDALEKPFDVNHLKEIVARHLSGR